MDDVVGVCFKPTGKVYYFSTRGLRLEPGQKVVAETSKGQELAEVVCFGAPCGGRSDRRKLKPVLRVASERDVERGRDSQERAAEARRVCQRLVNQLGLALKLVDVDYAFDGRRITFAFASEEKTDFRDLRLRLREIYDCEVELRQIGVRDQAKILGGLGPCGRPLCCASFLRDFQPVTIRMAKDQELSLNPTKISGQCGRLMCCLRYEHEAYAAARGALPKVGESVETPEGQGTVTEVSLLEQRFKVETGSGLVEVGAADLASAPSARGRTRRVELRARRAEAQPAPVLAGPSEPAPGPDSDIRSRQDDATEPRSRRRRRPRRRSARKGGSRGAEASAPEAPAKAAPAAGRGQGERTAAAPDASGSGTRQRRGRRRPRRRRSSGAPQGGGESA